MNEVIRSFDALSAVEQPAAGGKGGTLSQLYQAGYPVPDGFVILPQAVRRVLPPLGNDFISLLKDSSLATVLAVPELTQLGRIQRSSTFRVFEVFNTVTILYLSMTLVLSYFVRRLERRLSSERRTEQIR